MQDFKTQIITVLYVCLRSALATLTQNNFSVPQELSTVISGAAASAALNLSLFVFYKFLATKLLNALLAVNAADSNSQAAVRRLEH
jgi:hypothetical protein